MNNVYGIAECCEKITLNQMDNMSIEGCERHLVATVQCPQSIETNVIAKSRKFQIESQSD